MTTNSQVSTATNLTGPDVSIQSSLSNAGKYFNNFYKIDFNVSVETNDAIVSFFEKYTQNKATAKNLSAAVMYTAMAQNMNPATVLAEFQKMPKGELNSYLVAFLNVNRVPTSMVGIKGGTKTSPFITRSILL
ncbi:hypothetical protein UFOVP112_171 [uncultured Caudovirales phage]|uniref:Uncharacterized protein n=1 Tax=uncultured Caudovirales phage TaxID=2100421 RepID=A0A6J5L6V0_9CAUD|nr:hypothetical protein UFOVP112_171 [uncultured Caudovirales phage]